jgi:hypothetical protein
MEKFITSHIAKAISMSRDEYHQKYQHKHNQGYYLEYEMSNGITQNHAWYPTELFEILYKSVNQPMDFGQALKMLEAGHKVKRNGWHAPGMFLYLVPESVYKSFTNIAQKEFGESVKYGAYIAIKTAQGNVVPWQSSHTDMFSKDWVMVL